MITPHLPLLGSDPAANSIKASSSLDSRRSLVLQADGHLGELDAPEVSDSFSPSVVDETLSSSNPRAQPHASLTFVNGLALVLGLQIGSGIFSAPSQVSNHVPSPGAAVLIWLVGGIMVWTGAASFIELGLAIPKNGGIQEYLKACYGDYLGFLFTWIWIAISKPCAMAMIAMIFAENLSIAAGPVDVLSAWEVKVLAILGLFLITCINCLGTIAGARAANAFLILKLLAVFSIAATGIVMGVTGRRSHETEPEWFASDPDPHRQTMLNWAKAGEYITAIYGALFCYGGWESIGFVAGEMTDPSRDLPRVINTAMFVAVSGFVLMNIALFMVIPFETMRERSVVAVEFGLHVFGATGGTVYSLVVSASCLGALNANVFATGRLIVAASKNHYFPKFFGNDHCSAREEDSLSTRKALQRFPALVSAGILWFAERTETLRWDKKVPIYAMIMNASIATLYVVVGTFDSLVTFVGISEYSFFLLAVLGIFILRRRGKALNKRDKTWTFNPVIFCAFSAFLVIRGIITDPIQGLIIFSLAVIGWAMFRRVSAAGLI